MKFKMAKKKNKYREIDNKNFWTIFIVFLMTNIFLTLFFMLINFSVMMNFYVYIVLTSTLFLFNVFIINMFIRRMFVKN